MNTWSAVITNLKYLAQFMVTENLRPGPFKQTLSIFTACFSLDLQELFLTFCSPDWDNAGQRAVAQLFKFQKFRVLLQSNSFISSISMAMILTAAFVSLQLKGAELIKNHFAEKRGC